MKAQQGRSKRKFSKKGKKKNPSRKKISNSKSDELLEIV